ncbi:MAG TPA: dihydrodipicolinate reductase [Novosphingobium sp.]
MTEQSMRADWSRPYRVVQWATGNVGSRAMQRVIEHPGMELVGVWVSNPDKVGRDAGELCGISSVGVKATNSLADVIALKPDCVLYMPHVNRVDEVCAILESGANIVSTRMEYQNPAGLDPADRAKIEAACQKGGTSIHATGSSPGFISEAVPIVLTSIARRVDKLTITEFADTSSRNSPEMLFGPMMGFGEPAGRINEGMMHHMIHSFSPSLNLIAEAWGMPFDDVQARQAQGIARKDVVIPAGTAKAGTVAATKTVVSCMHKGMPLIEFQAIWYISSDVDTTDGEEWNFRKSGWHVLVEGDTPLDITIGYPVSDEDYPGFTPNLTAHRPVNCVPYVCAAKPGFVTTLDLPQVVARLA